MADQSKGSGPYYARAAVVLDLGPYEFDPEFWRKKIEVPKGILNQNGILEKVWHVSPHAMDRKNGTSINAKYKSPISWSRNIRCFLEVTALELNTDATGNRITGILFGTLEGKRGQIKARGFVLAQGGIEVPRFLLNSNKHHTKGVGNQHDLVGRYFMEHPFDGEFGEIVARSGANTRNFSHYIGSYQMGKLLGPGWRIGNEESRGAVWRFPDAPHPLFVFGFGLSEEIQRQHNLLGFAVFG